MSFVFVGLVLLTSTLCKCKNKSLLGIRNWQSHISTLFTHPRPMINSLDNVLDRFNLSKAFRIRGLPYNIGAGAKQNLELVTDR